MLIRNWLETISILDFYIDDYFKQEHRKLLGAIENIEEERIHEYEQQGHCDFRSLSKDEQYEIDDGDNLLNACDVLKGVLANEKR